MGTLTNNILHIVLHGATLMIVVLGNMRLRDWCVNKNDGTGEVISEQYIWEASIGDVFFRRFYAGAPTRIFDRGGTDSGS